jgi:Sensors of blue-light using FAD
MIQLVYCSQARVPFTVDALRELLVKARANNTPLGVTGCLLHIDGSFLQVLEGDAATVNALFTKIGRDPRHTHVVTLITREIEATQFPDWSMGFIDASGRASSVVGYRSNAGFTDLVGDASRIHQIVDGFRQGRWRAKAA